MTPAQRVALAHPCRLAAETIHLRFGSVFPMWTVVLTVNSGYE